MWFSDWKPQISSVFWKELLYPIRNKKVTHCCIFTLRKWVNGENKPYSGMMVRIVQSQCLVIFHSACIISIAFLYSFICTAVWTNKLRSINYFTLSHSKLQRTRFLSQARLHWDYSPFWKNQRKSLKPSQIFTVGSLQLHQKERQSRQNTYKLHSHLKT